MIKGRKYYKFGVFFVIFFWLGAARPSRSGYLFNNIDFIRPSSVRFQHRQSSFKELQYICDGDSNGVIYYAGTSYGEHQWVNPVLAKVGSDDLFLLLLVFLAIAHKKLSGSFFFKTKLLSVCLTISREFL